MLAAPESVGAAETAVAGMSRNRRSLTDLLPRAALALAAAALFAPSARADCTTHIPRLFDMSLPFPTTPAESRRDHALPRHKPCSGPSCTHHGPVPPAPAPAPQRSVGGDEPGWVSAGGACAGSAFLFLLRDASAGRPVRRAADVFHPPRLSPSHV